MIIKEIRVKTNLSQTDFAKLTGIPLRTIQAWEQGTRKPPEYVPGLIYKALKYENKKGKEGKIMIDFNTLRFLEILNTLAEKTKTGIVPFSKVHSDYYDEDGNYVNAYACINNKMIDCDNCIIYDDKHETTDMIFKETGCRAYPVISIACVAVDHHDIVSLYSDTYNCDVEVVISKTEKPYIRVQGDDMDDCICIEDGKWYFS